MYAAAPANVADSRTGSTALFLTLAFLDKSYKARNTELANIHAIQSMERQLLSSLPLRLIFIAHELYQI